MGNFTFEEMNLMCIYNTGSRIFQRIFRQESGDLCKANTVTVMIGYLTILLDRRYHQQWRKRAYGGRAGTAGPQRSVHFPHGFGCRCPSGGTGKEKVRHGAAEKPAQGRTQKDSAKKECGKGDLIWETLLLRK